MSYVRLADVSRPGFSKTAWSCPRHGEASRDGDNRSALAEAGWRLADDVTEDPAEGAQAAEAHVQADVRHAPVGRPQQEHGPFDPPALEVPVRCLAKRGAEHPAVDLLGSAAHDESPRIAASAAARSSQGSLPRPMRMLRSCPLPASRIVSPGRARRTACAIPCRRSSLVKTA